MKKLWNFILALFRQPEKKVERKARVARDNFGAMYYMGDLLENLDSYFVYLKMFKNHDPDTYALYSKIGGQVINSNALISMDDIHGKWKTSRTMPAFGMVHMGDAASSEDVITAKLIYYQKINSRWDVQKTNAAIYEVSVFYADKNLSRKKADCAVSFCISIDDEGNIGVLKEKRGSRVTIRGRGGLSSYTVQEWRIPPFLQYCLDENKNSRFKTPVEVAEFFFKTVANTIDNANSGFEVRCARDGLMAAFNIDMLRTPYFFKDRQKTVTVNGKTKKIFHIVRTHKRILADGTAQNVKSHFRGERKFKWNGYNVSITMSGKHHADVRNFNAEAHIYENGEPTPPNLVDLETLGQAIQQNVLH